MQYFIETKSYVAPCMFGSQKHLDCFLELCKQECQTKNEFTKEQSIAIYGDHTPCVGDRQNVTFYDFQYRDDFSKTQDELDFEELANIGEQPYNLIRHSIYPESVLKDAPFTFIDKQANWDKRKNIGSGDAKTMQGYLDRAEHIWKNMSEGENKLQTITPAKEEPAITKGQVNTKPRIRPDEKRLYYPHVYEHLDNVGNLVNYYLTAEKDTYYRELEPQQLQIIDLFEELAKTDTREKSVILLDMLKIPNIVAELQKKPCFYKKKYDTIEKGVDRELKREKLHTKLQSIKSKLNRTPKVISNDEVQQNKEDSVDVLGKFYLDDGRINIHVGDFLWGIHGAELTGSMLREEYVKYVEDLVPKTIAEYLIANIEDYKPKHTDKNKLAKELEQLAKKISFCQEWRDMPETLEFEKYGITPPSWSDYLEIEG